MIAGLQWSGKENFALDELDEATDSVSSEIQLIGLKLACGLYGLPRLRGLCGLKWLPEPENWSEDWNILGRCGL